MKKNQTQKTVNSKSDLSTNASKSDRIVELTFLNDNSTTDLKVGTVLLSPNKVDFKITEIISHNAVKAEIADVQNCPHILTIKEATTQ